jgi:hypothetical protein
MGKLKETLKEKFDYDVSDLATWKDNSMPNVITDLIANSEFLGDLTLEEGVKGTKEIALLNADVTLQAKSGCTPSPDGDVIFTAKDLTTRLLYMGIEFCNENLNTKMTQVLNTIGVKRQDGQLPADLDQILQAYLAKLLMRKAQRVTLLGNTASLDAELALLDGLVKRIDNDVDVVVFTSTETAIDATNAYDLAKGVYKKIDSELMDNGVTVNIYTGRVEALAILEQWNNENPYSQIPVPTATGSFTFALPLYGITVKSLPELSGLNKMYAIPTSLAFLGTDLESDMTFDIKYDDYNDKLKAEASFRLGNQIVWGKYFTRLELANS